MGLDSVELVLKTEEAFGISLPDDEMGQTITVGQFYEAILKKLPCSKNKRCLTTITFYRLHQPLLTVAGKQRGEIRPTTHLDALIPKQHRIAAWNKIRKLSGLSLPALSLSPLEFSSLLAVAMITVVAGVFGFGWQLSFSGLLGFLIFILAC
jgi:hypothetical protein